MNSNQPPALTVWYGSMPETNGKSNFTAILHRKGECISTGITVDRSEYPDRVRYEADRMRHLIGELQEKPCVLSYDANKHSGYVPPTPAQPVSQRYKLPDGWKLVPIEPTEGMVVNGFESEPDASFSKAEVWEEYDAMSGCEQAHHRTKLCWQAMLAAAPEAP